MEQFKRIKLTILALVVFISALLIVLNGDILKRETWLAEGQVVRLQLAPVDPRSIMQGDYMTLNYDIMASIRGASSTEQQDGFVRVQLDDNLLGQFVSIEPESIDRLELNPQQLLLQFRMRNSKIKLASNAFFFEEGQAKNYAQAKYGEFRVNAKGELLLAALLDNEFNKL